MGNKFKHPSLPGEYALKDGEWDIPAPAPEQVPNGYAVNQENVMRGLNEIFAKVNHKSHRQEGLTVNGMGLIMQRNYLTPAIDDKPF